MSNGFKNNFFPCAIIVASIAVVAVLGAFLVNVGMDWYQSLIIPTQFPPSIVFPIVWSIIYLTFAVVLCVWQVNWSLPTQTIILLIINGVVDVLWCLIFFTLSQTFLGLVAILICLIFSIVLWINIYSENKLYAYILSIFPVWIAIATCLNLSSWILN